jgi:sugar lactone lactonase YvrE
MTSICPSSLTPDNRQSVTLEVGDICIAATYAVGEVDIRRNSGEGRVLVYDKDLNIKGALWTDETGLVLGVEYCAHDETLMVSDASSKTIKRFSKDGKLLPSYDDQQGKPFGTMACRGDNLIVGEHIKGNKFPFVGGGEIYTFGADGKVTGHYPAEHDPGKFGFHGVTSLVVSKDGKTVTYISETGQRVMRYDLAGNRQLDDAFVMQGETMTAGLSQTDEGNLLISTVYGASLFSPTGEVLVEYDIPKDRGWAPVRVSADNTAFYIANFFTGRLEKRQLSDGKVLGAVDTELVFKLAAICEIPS